MPTKDLKKCCHLKIWWWFNGSIYTNIKMIKLYQVFKVSFFRWLFSWICIVHNIFSVAFIGHLNLICLVVWVQNPPISYGGVIEIKTRCVSVYGIFTYVICPIYIYKRYWYMSIFTRGIREFSEGPISTHYTPITLAYTLNRNYIDWLKSVPVDSWHFLHSYTHE